MFLRADGSAVRFANADELDAYDGGVGEEITEVGERETFEESEFLGLRLNEGLSVESLVREVLRRVGSRLRRSRPKSCTRRTDSIVDGRWKLTGRGRLVSSEVFGELLAVVA